MYNNLLPSFLLAYVFAFKVILYVNVCVIFRLNGLIRFQSDLYGFMCCTVLCYNLCYELVSYKLTEQNVSVQPRKKKTICQISI